MIHRTPAQVYDLWIAALESGAYQQTDGRLHLSNGGFCCLGVLCDLASKDGGPEWKHDGYMETIFNGEGYNLPPILAKYIGISFDEAGRLTKLNDAGHPFSSIAETIRKIKPAALRRVRRRKTI